MAERVERAGLRVDPALAAFVEDRALPGTGVAAEAFWDGLGAAIRDLGPRNRALLAEQVSRLPHVAATSTYVVMETVKEEG